MQLQREETVKRAVPVEVIKQMAALDLEEEPEKKLAVDMALFSFLACGMPFADIGRLGGRTWLKKEKCCRIAGKKTGALIEMEVSEPMQLLINRYRRADSKYLFPVLQEGSYA